MLYSTGKFISWLVNSTLNFSRKTDIARIANIGFSSEIYSGIHESGFEFSLNRIAFFLNEENPVSLTAMLMLQYSSDAIVNQIQDGAPMFSEIIMDFWGLEKPLNALVFLDHKRV